MKPDWLIYRSHSYGMGTLARLGVKLPSGRMLLVHHFHPHRQEMFHDHPWPFRTLVIWGGYDDETPHVDGTIHVDVLKFGSYRKRPSNHLHRTYTDRTTVTLVLTGPREREWREIDLDHDTIRHGHPDDFDATRGIQ